MMSSLTKNPHYTGHARLVVVDRFGGSGERFILWRMPTSHADEIAELLNRDLLHDASEYVKVVPEDYALHVNLECEAAPMNMKLVRTDNYGRSGEASGHDEIFLLWPMSKVVASRVAGELNDSLGECSDIFIKVVPIDYRLRTFEP